MAAVVTSRTSRIAASVALAGLLLGACSGTSSPSAPAQPVATVTALRVNDPAGPLKLGDTVRLTAVATLSDGRTLTTGFDVLWTSSNESVATVNAGLVTAKAVGNAAITATASGLAASAIIRVETFGRTLSGWVLQTVKEEAVMDATVTVLDGPYQGETVRTDPLGTFEMTVNGTVRLRVSAPYFEDTEVSASLGSLAVIKLAPVPGMIIDAIGARGPVNGQWAPQAELTFGQRVTGPAHLTVSAYVFSVEKWCGELRADDNRLLWQTDSTAAGDEAKATLTLTGGKRYALKVFDCSTTRPGMYIYRLRAEHM